MLPVYLINGFLESGKTEFIKFTIEQPYFRSRRNTLLLVCEEGESEYEERLLKKTNTILELVEDASDLTSQRMLELEKKYKPERIILEYNGMWNMKDMKLPVHWKVEQQITIIDGSTFPMYYTNMKSLVAEMVRRSEMIIFNRCDGIEEDLPGYKRNVKAVNPKAEIIFEGRDGEIDATLEEELPYDLNQSVIALDDSCFGVWYLDAMDHLDRYVGKTISFVAQVLRPKNFPKGYFVPGRLAMTCCADDMAFLGYACEYEEAGALKEKSWVQVTAVVAKEYFADYQGEGPILKATKVEACKAPKEEVISFT